MKRYVFYLWLISSFTAGIAAAYAIHEKAYQEGGMHRSAEFYVQVQEFNESVKKGKSFINGGWDFERISKKKPIYMIKQVKP